MVLRAASIAVAEAHRDADLGVVGEVRDIVGPRLGVDAGILDLQMATDVREGDPVDHGEHADISVPFP